MSDKVYGFCEAGCKRRVPTYEEFQQLPEDAVSLAQTVTDIIEGDQSVGKAQSADMASKIAIQMYGQSIGLSTSISRELVVGNFYAVVVKFTSGTQYFTMFLFVQDRSQNNFSTSSGQGVYECMYKEGNLYFYYNGELITPKEVWIHHITAYGNEA